MKRIYIANKSDLNYNAKNEGVGHITMYDLKLKNLDDYAFISYENDTFFKVLKNRITNHIGVYSLNFKESILNELIK